MSSVNENKGGMQAREQLPTLVAGVLFDMDDTLIDSERAWHEATCQMWREAGGELGEHDFLGGTAEGVAAVFVGELPDSRVQPEEYRDAVAQRLIHLIREHLTTELRPMPGASALLERLSGVVPLAIGSNSPSEVVQESVESLGWSRYFTAALGTNDVEHPKPAPDLYVAAAAALGADPRDCVVFEDSPLGTRAAVDAGAFVVTVGPAAQGHGHASIDSMNDPRILNWNPERA